MAPKRKGSVVTSAKAKAAKLAKAKAAAKRPARDEPNIPAGASDLERVRAWMKYGEEGLEVPKEPKEPEESEEPEEPEEPEVAGEQADGEDTSGEPIHHTHKDYRTHASPVSL